MDKPAAAGPQGRKKEVISLADERKRREMRELANLFERFYKRTVKHE